MFVITLMLVNLFVLNVNVFVNICNVLYICKIIINKKLHFKSASNVFVQRIVCIFAHLNNLLYCYLENRRKSVESGVSTIKHFTAVIYKLS